MGYILSILLSIPPLLAWNKIRELLTRDGFDAAMREGGTGLRGETMRYLALRLDALNITETQFIWASLIMAFFLIFVGVISDLVLEDRGFGPKGNGVLLLLGAGLSSATWVALTPREYMSLFSAMLFVSAVGAALTLVAAALLKRLIDAGFGGDAADRALRRSLPSRPTRGNPLSVLRRRHL